MDVYHYKKLLKLQQDDNGRIVTVYYLPYTGRMLKYEVINVNAPE